MNALDLLYIPIAAATAPWWARKQRSGWGERFGRIEAVADRGGGAGEGGSGRRPRILLHAVSVGEVGALRELVPLLTPSAQVIVSAGTDTGIKRARELFGEACDVVRYPLDASWAVRRFLDAVRPDAVALVELEVWPNFVRACGRGVVPVCVINGRLSERSFRGYSRLRRFFRPLFGALEFAAVQDEDYAGRFRAMGVPAERCLVTGSMKWDAAKIKDEVEGAEELASEMGIARGPGAPPLIVAGSTGPGEEALLAQVYGELERQIGPVQLLCAPRKPERFDEAEEAMGGRCIRRTRTKVWSGAEGGAGRRFLLDTIGELPKAYALADVVVMGRSFGDLYGSDPIEPIALGKATVIGPRVDDFAQIVAVFERAGGIVRATREDLGKTLRELLGSPAWRAEIAEHGRGCIRQMQGASRRHANLLLALSSRRVALAHPSRASVANCPTPLV